MVKYYLWFEMLLRELLNRNDRHVQGRLRSDIISLVAATQTILLHQIIQRKTYFLANPINFQHRSRSEIKLETFICTTYDQLISKTCLKSHFDNDVVGNYFCGIVNWKGANRKWKMIFLTQKYWNKKFTILRFCSGIIAGWRWKWTRGWSYMKPCRDFFKF